MRKKKEIDRKEIAKGIMIWKGRRETKAIW
jgi:hypothetical protein